MHMQLWGHALHPSCLPHIHALVGTFRPQRMRTEREVRVLQKGTSPVTMGVWLIGRGCGRSGRCMCCSRAAAFSACCWRGIEVLCSGGLDCTGQRTALQLNQLPQSFADAVIKWRLRRLVLLRREKYLCHCPYIFLRASQHMTSSDH